MTVVIKLGTSNITYETGRLNIRHVEKLVKVLSDLKNAGIRVVLVSSGAIAMGVGRLGLAGRPEDMPGKQAAAAVGQCELMYTYDKLFSEYDHTVAQVLLTRSDVANDARREHFVNTMTRLLEMGVLPIINENDTVSTDEIAVGDNDTLAAIVGCAIRADLVVLLSDIDGLYSADPHKDPGAYMIDVVEGGITPELEAMAEASGSGLAVGGMKTKLHAARMTMEAGIDLVIANGADTANLYNILNHRDLVGTNFRGRPRRPVGGEETK